PSGARPRFFHGYAAIGEVAAIAVIWLMISPGEVTAALAATRRLREADERVADLARFFAALVDLAFLAERRPAMTPPYLSIGLERQRTPSIELVNLRVFPSLDLPPVDKRVGRKRGMRRKFTPLPISVRRARRCYRLSALDFFAAFFEALRFF